MKKCEFNGVPGCKYSIKDVGKKEWLCDRDIYSICPEASAKKDRKNLDRKGGFKIF